MKHFILIKLKCNLHLPPEISSSKLLRKNLVNSVSSTLSLNSCFFSVDFLIQGFVIVIIILMNSKYSNKRKRLYTSEEKEEEEFATSSQQCWDTRAREKEWWREKWKIAKFICGRWRRASFKVGDLSRMNWITRVPRVCTNGASNSTKARVKFCPQ